MHPAYLREKARTLRVEKKLTIDQLAERLALPRTTIYYWVKDLSIPYMSPGRQAALPHLRKGNLRMQEKYRRLREEAYAQGRAEFAQRAEDPSFRDFVVLYLAEGYKRNRNVVSICNSDVAVLRVSLPWMEHFGGGSFEYSIQYHADQDFDELRQYWGRQLQIRPDEIRLQRKSNSGQLSKRTWRSRYGVLAIRCNDTRFRARLEGWMDCVREAWLHSP